VFGWWRGGGLLSLGGNTVGTGRGGEGEKGRRKKTGPRRRGKKTDSEKKGESRGFLPRRRPPGAAKDVGEATEISNYAKNLNRFGGGRGPDCAWHGSAPSREQTKCEGLEVGKESGRETH